METLRTKSFRFLDFELDGVRRVLSRSGRPVALNPKALDLLLVLIESRGEVMSKDVLLERVWPGQFVEEGNLTVHISTLRKAFGEGANDHRFIVTVPGRGYSFVANLDDEDSHDLVVESHSYSDIVVEDTEAVSTEISDSEPAESIRLLQPAARISSWLRISVGVGVLVLIVAASAAYLIFLRTPATPQPKSVAVMPFANETGNADLEYLSDGLTESLIARLSRVPELSVRARTSIARYKGKELDLPKIGADLGVEAIMTGRLVARGDEITFYAELIEPATEKVLWKRSYDRSLGDLASLEAAVARDIAKSLKAKLSPEDQDRLLRGQTNNSAAYELQLRGLQFSREGSTFERLKKSVECYEQAIKLDPNYAEAYVGLAWTYIRLGTSYGYLPAHESYPKAREALLKAVELDEELSSAHSALATYYLNYEWNWKAAGREFERSIELDPEDPGTLADYAFYYDTLGRPDDALRMRDRARKLLPASAQMLAGMGLSSYYGRRYDDAISWYNKALELNPRLAYAYNGRGRSHLDSNRATEAVADIEKATELFGRSPRSMAVLANCYARVGRTDDARRILSELQQRATNEYVAAYYYAVTYAGLDDREQAFVFLDKAREERQPQMGLLRVEPFFDRLRPDPRFEEAVRKVGIP